LTLFLAAERSVAEFRLELDVEMPELGVEDFEGLGDVDPGDDLLEPPEAFRVFDSPFPLDSLYASAASERACKATMMIAAIVAKYKIGFT
jgi:hypothetical protein